MGAALLKLQCDTLSSSYLEFCICFKYSWFIRFIFSFM